jgi:hypothetical protein
MHKSVMFGAPTHPLVLVDCTKVQIYAMFIKLISTKVPCALWKCVTYSDNEVGIRTRSIYASSPNAHPRMELQWYK